MEKEIKGYKIEIAPDEDPIDPRGDDNLGTMVCFHNRYNLGDKHDYHHADYNSWGELKEAIIKNENPGVILPLYLYDHSGITMNTTGFDCPWDSGQIGWIFISKKKILEEYGRKKVSRKLIEKVREYLIAEVKTYDQYLTGDVYGFRITKDGVKIDSCWGYYGEDECMREAESIVDCMTKEDK